MAALIKFNRMPLVLQRCAVNHLYNMSRNISTSKKNSDASSAACVEKNENKNWVSYGFDYKSQEDDTNYHNATFFFAVSLCLVFGGFAWAYAPDVHMRDWAQREAFLELRRREKCGLPPIDPNYVDPKCIRLPSDEELENVEIII